MDKIHLYTTYYSNNSAEALKCQKVSVANYMPERVCLPEWEDVAPVWSLIVQKKQGKLTWEQFIDRYEWMLNYCTKKDMLSFLRNMPTNHIALTCWEHDADRCHRVILAKWLQKNFPEQIEYHGELCRS